jgi:pimeloyl-ACP methyl ester carboxylesterase
MVDDCYQLLGYLGIEKAVVGGLSFGGYLSLHFYHHHPEMVQALILINTGPGYRTAERAAQWNEGLLERADILEKGGMQGLIDSEYSVPDYTPRELMLTLDPIGLSKFCRGATINPHGVDKLKDIAVPTRIVIGEDDVGLLAAADYMAARIPQSEKVAIANAGHGVNIDQPEVFNQVVLDFLHRIGV